MSSINLASLITNGDTSLSVIYRLIDSAGRRAQSTPYVLPDALVASGQVVPNSMGADGQWIRIPTLRHLLPGTAAQIELYIGSPDRQLFKVYENDPTVDYIDVCPQIEMMTTADASVMISLTTALDRVGATEDDYSLGDGLVNDPPPLARCLTVWRNRVICCEGNNIHPSFEFEDGVGLRWNNTTRVEWNEGTGEITAICPIDWNYCAVFKQDAIGFLSGPGPDGTGHGNYIVQTLQTKMGVTNPKSVVNGSDGCYFQDATTKRIAVITPQLGDPKECMVGWFNTEQANVTAALQVEALRQVWFATDDGQIVVLDYKHRTERCPLGQVFTWDASALGTVVGLTQAGGSVVLAFSDGKLAVFVESQAYDQAADGTKHEILRDIETGELQPFGSQGMGDISKIQVLGEYISAHGLELTVIPQFGDAADPVSREFEGPPENLGTRPADCMRVQSVRLRLTETLSLDSTGSPVYGKGLKFVGFAMEVVPRGRLQTLDVEEMI